MIRSTTRILAVLTATLGASTTAADELHVPGDHATIGQAIAAALAGDEVVVAPGTWTESLDLYGKAITLRGSAPTDATVVAATILQGDGTGPVVRCVSGETSSTRISGLTIRGGGGVEGGGLLTSLADPLVSHCVFRDNHVDLRGGGVAILGGEPVFQDCTFRDNTAREGGGVFLVSATVLLVDCLLEQNEADGQAATGAGISNYSASLTLLGCTIRDNRATAEPNHFAQGGAINNLASTITLVGCTITGNEAGDFGGGFSNYATIPALTDTTVCGNTPDQLPGLWTDNGGNSLAEECPGCPGDLDGSGLVGEDDVRLVLRHLGRIGRPGRPGDANADGSVDVDDLRIVVRRLGSLCDLKERREERSR